MTKYTIKQKGYFYDATLKRYLVQLMSCFAGYRVRSGKQRDGEHRMISVPVIYGDNNRAAAYTMSGGNENAIISLPMIAVDMTRLKQAEQYRRAPQHVERLHWTERASQNIEGNPGTTPGTHWSAERYMPVPYDLGIRLNLWSSNADQSFQLLEQIMTQFNPEVDIQVSNSPMDWSFMTTLKFDGDVAIGRTSAGIGEGAKDDPYYVHTLDFSTIIYLSPPTKVYEAKIIETIHANIKQLNDERDFDTMTDLETFIITDDGIE